jgi:tRNA(Ile)-lysidine synthase
MADSTNGGKVEGLPAQLLAAAEAGGYIDLLLRTPLLVGVSGGADSVALIHALLRMREDRSTAALVVAHFNHGLRPEADEDEAFVEGVAHWWGLPFVAGRGDVAEFARENRLSIEDAARRLRYAWFRQLLSEDKAGWAVAVAHTADDQAETVLMSILRGSGLAGLAGMTPIDTIPPTGEEGDDLLAPTLFRPLLGVWREDVVAYLASHDISYINDPSNEDPSFTRNRVRHQLMPLLANAYNPGVKRHLANLAAIVHADNAYIDSRAEEAWSEVARPNPEGDAIEIRGEAFARLHPALQTRVVRLAVEHLNGSVRDLAYGHTDGAARLLSLSGGEGGAAHLPGGLVAERRQYWAGIRRVDSTAAQTAALREAAVRWPIIAGGDGRLLAGKGATTLEEGWVCEVDVVPEWEVKYSDYEAAFSFKALGSPRVALRARSEGDRVKPLGMEGTRKLKELFIDAKIPEAVRGRIALVTHPRTDEVLWVPGPGGARSSLATVKGGSKRVVRVRMRKGEREGV